MHFGSFFGPEENAKIKCRKMHIDAEGVTGTVGKEAGIEGDDKVGR